MRVWTCRRCRVTHGRLTQKCGCGQKRPAPRRPKHQAALDLPYEAWVERFGERCGICGSPPKPGGKLNRDHEHVGDGRARGVLCWKCNKFLHPFMTVEWMRAALAYLERTNAEIRSGARSDS